MNYQKKYRQNIDLLQRYADYLLYCESWEQRIKLSCEIARLQHQNETIEKMGYIETLKDINDYYITIHWKDEN